jgi:hypothetical protein
MTGAGGERLPGAAGLKAFQRRMAAAVMAPLTSRETMARRRKDGVRMEAEAAAFVKPNDRLTSFERLEIYNRQYWYRLLDCLREDFPGLLAVLGSARFDRLARAYLAECPSMSFTLRNLGSRLEPWLRAHPGWAGPRAALALDMVRLEWAHVEAFDLAEWPALGAADLGEVGVDTRLALQPHLRLLHLDHPVDDLVIALRRHQGGDAPNGDAPGGHVPGNGAVAGRHRRMGRRVAALPPGAVFLAVHRHDHSVYYKRLEPEAYRILAALRAGAPLGAALEAGLEAGAIPGPERPAFLRAAFHDWAALRWFALPPPTWSEPDAL